MLRRPSLLLVGPVFLLATSALVAEPIFDPRPGHPWDQAREAFYARRFTTGEVFEHPHASAPPWHEFMPFTHDADFHERVGKLLEAVEKLPPAQMEEQPAARRLVLLRDLWAIFDALRWANNRWPKEDEDVATKALARRDELLQRIARVMRRLELTEEEVRALPDAFKITADKKLYPKAFDPAAGDKAFFPSDLLDKDGPWLAYSGEKEPSAGGVLHTNFVNQRSVFTLHLRAPDGRDGGVKFFRDYVKADRRLDIPPGSTLALLSRAVVPTRSGKLLVSPLVESLQLIVVTPPKDRRFKFALDRKELIAGNLGLKPLGKDDPADFSSFGDAVLWGHPVDPRKKDANGETFITGKYNTVKDMPRALDVCVKCHRDTLGNSVIGSGGPLLPHVQSDPDKADAAVVKKKESSDEWKLYLRLREHVRPSPR
jgi:hypothetical protein